MDKNFYIERYLKLKEQLGRKPKYREFLKTEKINRRHLDKIFGNSPFTKLQIECGDKPNKLIMERTPLDDIFKLFGNITRQLGKLPTQADWSFFDCKPTVSGIEHPPHNIKWSELPNHFVEFAVSKSEWKDVVEIIRKVNPELLKKKLTNKQFETTIAKINEWHPQRKRFNEEGYKIELRAFLQKNSFNIQEEKGESNIDLLVNNSIAVELKKDPSTADYDRLIGQMARHLMNHKFLVVVICDISNEDRYKTYLNTVDFIFSKLDLNLKIIGK